MLSKFILNYTKRHGIMPIVDDTCLTSFNHVIEFENYYRLLSEGVSYVIEKCDADIIPCDMLYIGIMCPLKYMKEYVYRRKPLTDTRFGYIFIQHEDISIYNIEYLI